MITNQEQRLNRRAVGRLGGRAARIAARQSETGQINPCPPGARGGQYRPLATADITRIIDAAFDILARIGMGDISEPLAAMATTAGATLNHRGRLCFSRDFLEDIIDGAAKSFILHGRDPQYDVDVTGERVYFGTGGAAVQTLDLDSGLYRPSTARDIYDFARLTDRLTNVSWFSRCCVATDATDRFDLDINTAYAMLAGTVKPIGMSFSHDTHVDAVADMFDEVLGGTGQFFHRPFCKAHVAVVIPPLRFADEVVSVLIAAIRRGMPINMIIAAQAGATAPATLAGMLAQTTAETLAGLALVNMIQPGHPMIFSNWPFVLDLRSGAFSGGGGEIALLNAAAAQIGNHLGLPSGIASSMTDAKTPDAQMGAEKALTALAAGLSGANLVYESSGMMASLLGVSFEAFVADDEMLSHVYRLIRGIEVNDETLGLEAIEEAVSGSGHFLGSDHTLAAMQRDYFYPRLANRDEPRIWAERGAPDLRSQARARARDILDNHYPRYLDPDIDDRLRERYNILIPKEFMTPEL